MAADKVQSKSEAVATVEQVEQAIRNLTAPDLAKLHAFAENRARAMRLRGSSFEGIDLLQQAVVSLLEERRHWKPNNADFVCCLIGAMRSIASNYRTAANNAGYELPESQLASQTEDEPCVSPMDRAVVDDPGPEQAAIISELIAKAKEKLADDAEAVVVIGAWDDGMSGTAIMAALDINRTAYETIVRRIRRQANDLWTKGNSNVH